MPIYGSLDDAALLRACLQDSEAAAWEEFVCRFHSTIAGVAGRLTRRRGIFSPALVDDLVQETYLRLCANRHRLVQDFVPAGPGALRGFLKTVAANVVCDHFRAARAQKRSGIAAEAEPFGEAGVDQSILLQQIDTCLQSALAGRNAQRDELVFRLYYRQGFSASAIATVPGIRLSTKGVESVILRLTRLVRANLEGGKTSTVAGERKMVAPICSAAPA